MSDLHSVVGRALSDPEFCERLITAPEVTLSSCGVEPTPELVRTLHELDADAVRRLAGFFNQEQAAG